MELFTMSTIAVLLLMGGYALYKFTNYLVSGGMENRYEYVEDADGNVIKVVDLRDTDESN